MNFFKAQNLNKTNSLYLISLFTLTLIINPAIIISLILVILLLLNGLIYIIEGIVVLVNIIKSTTTNTSIEHISYLKHLIYFIGNHIALIYLALLVVQLVLVLVTKIYKIKELRYKDGRKFIESLGGHLVSIKNKEQKELLTIVEETAIALGTKVPQVYILKDEIAVNSFSIGMSVNNSFIIFTAGAIKEFNKDEIRVITTYELLNIISGQTRTNTLLIDYLYPILLSNEIGKKILRQSPNRLLAKILGATMMLFGSFGNYSANKIKLLISGKEIKYFNDRATAKILKNPQNLVSVLRKIGSPKVKSILDNPKSIEINHMCFAKASRMMFDAFCDTQPSIRSRIYKIYPEWNGKFYGIIDDIKSDIKKSKKNKKNYDKKINEKLSLLKEGNTYSMSHNIGKLNYDSIDKAHDLIQSLSKIIIDSIHNPNKAKAVVYSVFMAIKKSSLEKQFKTLQKIDFDLYKLTKEISVEINKIDKSFYLSLIDISIPNLKRLKKEEYEKFKKNILALLEQDERIDLFEWSLKKVLFHALEKEFDKNYQDLKPKYILKDIPAEGSLFLSLIANNTNKDLLLVKEAFFEATMNQGLDSYSFLKKNQITISALNEAIDKIDQLQPLEKEKFIKACAICMVDDGDISVDEINLLRAFCNVFHCPMPL